VRQRPCGTPKKACNGYVLQILFAIILVGKAIELCYVVKAICSTNCLLAALLKHVNPS
jgi:hypothetical protein